MTGLAAAPDLPDWLQSQLPFRRYLVDVGDGLRVHVMEQGEGRPVVLFHGNPTWGYLYRKVAAELEGEPLRLIMPDLVGLGFSDRPASADEHTLVNHSAWMARLLERLDLEDVVAVVQDWGGAIGTHALMQHEGMMTALLVMNTPIGAPRPGFKPTLFHRLNSTKLAELVSTWTGFPQNWIGLYQGERRSITGLVRRSYAYPLSRSRGNEAFIGLVRMVPDTMEHPSVPAMRESGEFVESFRGPTAIVWGERDPVLGRLRRRVTRQLPNAEVTVTDAGHFLQEQVPVEIADAIRGLVSRPR